jgi:hypothetical protein
MANTVNGILTTYGSVVEVELTYFFAITASGFTPNAQSSSYFFIGKPDQWPDDNNPPIPTQDQAYIKQTYKHMFATKLVTSSNLSPVVPRIDWTTGTVYTPYTDYDNMFTTDANGIITKPFYVRNRYDQIFKCLSNDNGAVSTVEPILQAGSTDATQTLYLSDGYKWIYVTTIDKGLKKSFFDNQWMPLAVGISTPNPLTPAGLGSINAINVTNPGSGYSNGVTTTVVTINGDGQGATAYANVDNNMVQDVIVTSTGNNYTYSTVTISPQAGYFGNNATANAIISPIGGHGYDPVSELGCNHIMLSVEIDGSENGNVPTDVSFRQVGVIINPLLTDGTVPTGSVYNTSDLAIVSFGLGSFLSGETVYQGSSANNASFTATVCSFDSGNNVVSLINTVGTYTLGAALYGATSGTSRVLLQYTPTSFSVGSGYAMYFENRQPVQRSPNGNEQLRLVLRF